MNSLGVYRIDANTVAYFGYQPEDYSNVYELREDSGGGGGDYFEGQELGSLCNGFTRIVFRFKGGTPYSTTEYQENAPLCGYVTDVCDIFLPYPIAITNETFPGENDGTVKVFAVSSFEPIQYFLTGYPTSSTGYFTDVPPGTYTWVARDNKGCQLTGSVTVEPATIEGTRYKYRLAFDAVKEQSSYELKFLDQKHIYPIADYPKDLIGTDIPIMKKETNSNEDKTEAICPSSLSINIYYDGETFSVLEFANAAERDWKIELYKNGELDWQGWLLPDELQDLYADPNYPIQLIATDGLLSLKGTPFGDINISYIDGSGITRLVQLFGLRTFRYLFKICLEQLGYDYGDTIILSSLCYKSYESLQWKFYATWIDLFYDENGIARDTFSVFETLLKGMHLQIFQNKGRFIIWDINDIYYRNNSVLATRFAQSIIEFDSAFDNINYTPTYPGNATVGYNRPIRPINPQQTLNYDKAFNQCEASVDFSLLSLFYPNPSFEFNAVEGQVPYLMEATANMSAFSHYDPPTAIIGSGAYIGEWELRTVGLTLFLKEGGGPFGGSIVIQAGTDIFFSRDGYRSVLYGDVIDQPNKKLNLSFVWRPQKYSEDENVVPRIAIYFIADGTGQLYIYSFAAKGGYNGTGWYIPDHDFGFVFLNQRITDYIAWNSFSLTTDKFPESGIGTVGVYIGTPIHVDEEDMTSNRTIDYDQLTITQSDANDIYNFQKGEKHNITNVTSYAKSEKKNVDIELFTFPNNKRIAGNVGYGDDYLTSKITNEWFFQLSTEQRPDRLPANIIKRIAKNYQRPMYKWQGDIYSDNINMYTVFAIDGLPNRVFIAFTIEMDLRNCTGNVVLIEVDDSQTQSGYNYIPIYERSARNNAS